MSTLVQMKRPSHQKKREGEKDAQSNRCSFRISQIGRQTLIFRCLNSLNKRPDLSISIVNLRVSLK